MNKDVLDIIKNDRRFSILSKMLENSGLGEALANEQNAFTFFAPTDKALSHFSTAALRLLTSPKGKDLALAVIGRHVIPDSYLYSRDLQKARSLTPLFGADVKVTVKDDTVRFGRSPVQTPGIAARNGVVFSIDRIQPLQTQKCQRSN